MDVILDVLPVAGALAGTALAWWVVSWLVTRDPDRREALDVRRQVLLMAVVVIGVVAVVLTLPVDLQLKGALLGAIGVALAAVIGLSSTTIVGNALAGLMLRSVGNFKVGDFLSVEGQFGRVTYRRLVATEIQTEDGDLTTLPNLFLATHPVKVVRSTGTVVSALLSIGYDVHRLALEPLFKKAAEDAGLSDPFVYVVDLGDHAVTYRVAGFLTEVKQLLSVRSALRGAIVDRLGGAGIEIVSPSFVNRRAVGEGPVIAPPPAVARVAAPEPEPEDIVFDKAEAAAAVEELRAEQEAARARLAELEELRRAADEQQGPALDRDIAELRARIGELAAEAEAAPSD